MKKCSEVSISRRSQWCPPLDGVNNVTLSERLFTRREDSSEGEILDTGEDVIWSSVFMTAHGRITRQSKNSIIGRFCVSSI